MSGCRLGPVDPAVEIDALYLDPRRAEAKKREKIRKVGTMQASYALSEPHFSINIPISNKHVRRHVRIASFAPVQLLLTVGAP